MAASQLQTPAMMEQRVQYASHEGGLAGQPTGPGVASQMIDPSFTPAQAQPTVPQNIPTQNQGVYQNGPAQQLQQPVQLQQQPQQQQQQLPVAQQPQAQPGAQMPAKQTQSAEKNPSDTIITVANDFKAVEGKMLTEGLFVGRKLGGGMQGGVYEVKDKNGNVDMSQVLKVSYSAALLSNIKREWEIGRRLNSLAEPTAALNGYMGTGAGIQRQNGKFMGMMLERINGDGVNKHIEERGIILDIYYIREALFAIFTALDVGQRSYGFHHMDLRMDNVMEQLPPKENPGISPSATKPGQTSRRINTPELVDNEAGANSRFKIIDFGLASFDEQFAAGMVQDIPENGRQLLHGLRNFKLNFHLIPEVSPLEKWYRWLWSRKGDIYAVLWDLCRHLDGRYWPRKDRVLVRLLLSLIFHVTGTNIIAQFVDVPESEIAHQPSKQTQHAASFGALGVFEKNDGALHVLRIRYIRIKSWLRPRNPGITAAEALCAPFFQYQIGQNLEESASHGSR